MEKKEYYGIDLFKFIMSFCVIAIHTSLLNEQSHVFYSLIIRMAVPFFFLSTGFLLSNKLNDSNENEYNLNIIKNQIIKFLKKYLFWSFIYLPLTIYGIFFFKYSLVGIVRNFLFVGEEYNSWQLWYLLSSVYAFVFLFFCFKRNVNSKKMITIIFLIIVLKSLFDYYEVNYENFNIIFIVKVIRKTIRNFRIFNGIIFIPIGIKLKKVNVTFKINTFLFFLSLLLDYYIKNIIVSEYISIITIISLFNFVKELNLKKSIIYIYFRKMSSIIYYIHMYIFTIYSLIRYKKINFGFEMFLVTSILSFVFSIMYIFISKKIENNQLNKEIFN